MSETDQNLFAEATTGTLEDFENVPAQQSIEQPTSEPNAPEPATSSQDGEEDQPGHVPSTRFREEADARRRAEREAADLRAQIAAFQAVQQARQPQQPQNPVDIFDNPQSYVEQIVQQRLDAYAAQQEWDREQGSRDNAIRNYGNQTVAAAYQALQQGVQMNDPTTMNVWQAARKNYDPYGLIVRWHQERQTLSEIGGDLNGYKQRIVQEAMKDPNFQKQFVDFMRSNTAQQMNVPARTGQFTQQKVPYVPSLSDMGTAAPDEQISDASDEALFRAAVSAKKRRT